MNLMRGMGGGGRNNTLPTALVATIGGVIALPWVIRNLMEIMSVLLPLIIGFLVTAVILRGLVWYFRRPW